MTVNVSIDAAAELVSQDDLDMLQESVAKVLETRCDSQAVHAFIDGKSELDKTLWGLAADLGWLALSLPEAYGGMGLGPQGLKVVHRELGRRLAPGPFIATLTAAQWLVEMAADAEKDDWLPRIAAGEVTVAIPAVPAAPGADAGLMLKDGKLHGALRVLGAADSSLVLAPTPGGWALVAGDAVTLSPIDVWDRTRQVCDLTCDGAAPLALIDDRGGMATRALARHLALAVAADSVGGVEGIAHQTIDYMKTRVQFDKPIGAFQAMKHRAADMVSGDDTQEHLLAQGVEAAAAHAVDADMWAALAKAGAADWYAFVAGDCIQLHGGVGHTWEFDVHIYAKRSRLNQVLGGDSRRQRDFAAQELATATRDQRSTTELGL